MTKLSVLAVVVFGFFSPPSLGLTEAKKAKPYEYPAVFRIHKIKHRLRNAWTIHDYEVNCTGFAVGRCVFTTGLCLTQREEGAQTELLLEVERDASFPAGKTEIFKTIRYVAKNDHNEEIYKVHPDVLTGHPSPANNIGIAKLYLPGVGFREKGSVLKESVKATLLATKSPETWVRDLTKVIHLKELPQTTVVGFGYTVDADSERVAIAKLVDEKAEAGRAAWIKLGEKQLQAGNSPTAEKQLREAVDAFTKELERIQNLPDSEKTVRTRELERRVRNETSVPQKSIGTAVLLGDKGIMTDGKESGVLLFVPSPSAPQPQDEGAPLYGTDGNGQQKIIGLYTNRSEDHRGMFEAASLAHREAWIRDTMKELNCEAD